MRFLVLLTFFGLAAAVQQTCSPSDCNPRAISTDFTFIVDVSSSLGSIDNFNRLKVFLSNFASGITFSPEDSQLAIYTYSTNAKNLISLKSGSTSQAILSAIQSMTFDNTNDRQIYQALNKEESEVTAANGFRAGYKHVMVVISGDAWTGQTIIGSSLLTSVQKKYDLVLTIGLGKNAAANQLSALLQLAGQQSSLFLASNFDQLPYVAQWIYNYACPGTHMVTPVPTTTAMPTPNPSVPCSLGSLNYDIYLIVDTSTSLSTSDFAALKQTLLDFVGPIPVGDGKTQFALEATSIDSENYYTAFHNGQDRGTVLYTLQTITQDGSSGQSLKLSLQAIQRNYLSKNYSTNNKLIVYFTGSTNFDTDPNALMSTLKSQYGVKAVAIQWGTGATTSALQSFTGGSSCVLSATNAAQRATVAPWLQTKMCKAVFC